MLTYCKHGHMSHSLCQSVAMFKLTSETNYYWKKSATSPGASDSPASQILTNERTDEPTNTTDRNTSCMEMRRSKVVRQYI